MDEHIAKLAMLISGYSTGLPFLIGLIFFRRFNLVQKYLFILVAFSIGVELSANFIGRWYLHMNNLPLLHLFSVGQFTLLWLIFGRRLVPPISRNTYRALLVFFYAFALICTVWLDGIFNFNAYARTFGAVLVIFLCLFYYYQCLKTLTTEYLEHDPLFWIATGSLIYFSGSVILFIISNYVMDNQEMSLTMWGIHAILNTLNNLFYAIALWVKPDKR